ncbi:MAG: hypothetical protein INR73_18590 [Williamsia sp.]|nr:hypothetical protein [Williamsia sp.]
MDNTVVIVIIGGTLILMLVASFTLSVVFAYQKKYYKHLQEINAIKENFQQELFKTQLEIKEQTLQNISQEIHDNIGQVLSLANMQLTAIELINNRYATHKIDKAMELVSKAIHDLRNLSKSLSADSMAKLGLIQSVNLDLGLIERTGKLGTSLQVTGAEVRIDPAKEIIVYRIIQEAINNIIKHAKASQISIVMNYSPQELEVRIADNGKGFTRKDKVTIHESGTGLQNMMNRAQLIRGSLHIESDPAQGTTVLLIIPTWEKTTHDTQN